MAKIRISIETTITSYAKKKGKDRFSLGLGIVKLTESQRNQLDPLIDDVEKVRLIIERVQEKLPGTE